MFGWFWVGSLGSGGVSGIADTKRVKTGNSIYLVYLMFSIVAGGGNTALLQSSVLCSQHLVPKMQEQMGASGEIFPADV